MATVPQRPSRFMDGSAVRPVDSFFLILVLLLLSAGLPMLYSASYRIAIAQQLTSVFYVERQLIYAIFGMLSMLVLAQCDLRKVRGASRWLYVASLVLLALVLFTPLGRAHGGAKRWLFLGVTEIQPSEFGKIALVLFLADLLAQFDPKQADNRKLFWKAGGAVLATVVLVFREPHLSASILIVIAAGAVMFAAGLPLRDLAKLAATGVAALALVVLVTCAFKPHQTKAAGSRHQYQIDRIISFLTGGDPEANSYQPVQAVRAIENGGISGTGFCRSIQKHLWLPAAHTDFIFAIIGEELGLLGTWGTILLFGVLGLRGFHIAHTCRDQYGSLICTGLTALITAQCALNIGVTTRILPPTGIALPFFSHGGSFMLCTLIAVGLMLNVSRSCTTFRRI